MPKFRIKCHEDVRYDQTVTLNEEEAAELRKLQEKANAGGFKEEKAFAEYVDDMVDRHDMEDGDGLEDIEVEEVDEDEEKKEG